MAFLSLLPAVGVALVRVPVAAYYVMAGAVLKGFGLAAYGVLVSGLVDNLLRARTRACPTAW
jgi:predicted PurR-regulated permease PerM